MRPFEGIKILDCTHVLAGPFAAYQLAVLGADVVKVDDPNAPDQSRESGADMALNKQGLGTGFLTQGSNKRCIALDLKTEGGRAALKKLATEWADILVENYRPGAFKALGLGYDELSKLNPRLIYASMTAFGQNGPRGYMTAYDQAIQATSGITASTGTPTSGPIKAGAPVIDYATGTTGAFALATALFQRTRTNKGQYIDMAMMDVAMILQASHMTDYLHSGHHPKRNGNKLRFAPQCAYETKDGSLLQIAASNARQHKRFFEALGNPEEGKRNSLAERYERFDEKYAFVTAKMKEKTAAEWEEFFQQRHIPACRVRELREAVEDPQIRHRGLLHRFDDFGGSGKPMAVPLTAFRFAHGGASIERAPGRVGQHTDEVLKTVGYGDAELAALRAAKAIM
jgi:crotonobetainyl-CoA:carnitine CoA-transferase CaiB-like acyl-CoA transferase